MTRFRLDRTLVPLLIWAFAYGVAQSWSAVAVLRPADLGGFSGVPAVVLCAGAAATALWQHRAPSRASIAVGGLLAALLAVAPYRIILDLFGLVYPGSGIPFATVPFASRALCLTGAVLLAVSTVAAARRRSPGKPSADPLDRPPRWAWISAYLVVAAFGARMVWQTRFEDSAGSLTFAEAPLTGALTMLPFAAAGVVLPLALVHSWGRVFPRWVPFAAGRRVPRPLLLIPAALASVLILAYFASGTLSLATTALRLVPGDAAEAAEAADILAGTWLADVSYVTWGVGLAAAAVGYHRVTRQPPNRAAEATP